MVNSTLYKFVKVIPKRKYLIISNERWDNKFLGIFEVELNGSDLFIESEHDVSNCLRYIPQEVTPLLDTELNNSGVKHTLFVSPITDQSDRSFDLNLIKNSNKYISYMRDVNIDKII